MKRILTIAALLSAALTATAQPQYRLGRYTVEFYGPDIVRITDGPQSDPVAEPPAAILVDSPREDAGPVEATLSSVATSALKVEVTMEGLLRVISEGKVLLEQESVAKTETVQLEKPKRPDEDDPNAEYWDKMPTEKTTTTVSFKTPQDEYLFGGGVQNGRFSHKGHKINVVNENNWTDGGVCSPAPFFWSTAGYGVMWYTFAPGCYDFTAPGEVTLSHDTDHFDLFVMAGRQPADILNCYYQLTGEPVLIPKFGFYEGHLNAYNRDWWAENEEGILFEDGKKYKESQKDNGGIRESLNGEKDNYQFSARAVVDRYQAADMPLGWILPNDGYGAGYGQEETLDGNIANLRSFGDYARSKGVEIGLWTQSDLHPKEGVEALLQRDLEKEVGVAGVRVLKTDVAWVGDGYSFGLNGISDAAAIMTDKGAGARPFIITLDGWAGTQRYGTVWTGDQTGGEWEYIRFHIPTYICAGLGGQPNITSDDDGIFGGLSEEVNVRDFQWKAFGPMELNMDGWGRNPKYPQAISERATELNRKSLKLKSSLMPYAYSIAWEATHGLPMIRAMMLEYPNDFTMGSATRYQYMYGPWLLVSPVFKAGETRDNIYLPEGEWIDWENGEVWDGGCVVNSFDAPLEKIPVFVKPGAIIPMTEPHNNVSEWRQDLRMYEIYPCGESSFTEYDDDGRTVAYKAGAYATTLITSREQGGDVTITVAPSQGSFDGMVSRKSTVFKVATTSAPSKVKVTVGGRKCKGFTSSYDGVRFLTVTVPECDVTADAVVLTLKGVAYNMPHVMHPSPDAGAPEMLEPEVSATKVVLKWESEAEYCDIVFDGMTYTNIRGGQFAFEDLEPDHDYSFKVMAGGSDHAAEVSVRTSRDPYEHAVKGITGTCTAEAQPGQELERLFDFTASGDMWHTKWGQEATPFVIEMDLHSFNRLDKVEYVPRADGWNGLIYRGSFDYSIDGREWVPAGEFFWERDAQTKTFEFKDAPEARYVRMNVRSGASKFGSGREIYVFRVPGSKWSVAGDINADGRVDEDDLTSYMNYTGLRKGDADFEGYISKGDLNGNGLIDAADIAEVASSLEGGWKPLTAQGLISVSADKSAYKAGETAVVTVSGSSLSGVNAFSLCLPYDATSLSYDGLESFVPQMTDFTYDRLHSNGEKVLHPTFVNVGAKASVEGSGALVKLRFKVLRDCIFSPEASDIVLK